MSLIIRIACTWALTYSMYRLMKHQGQLAVRDRGTQIALLTVSAALLVDGLFTWMGWKS